MEKPGREHAATNKSFRCSTARTIVCHAHQHTFASRSSVEMFAVVAFQLFQRTSSGGTVQKGELNPPSTLIMRFILNRN